MKRFALCAGLALVVSSAFVRQTGLAQPPGADDLGVGTDGFEGTLEEQDAIESWTVDLGSSWVPPIFSHADSPFAPTFVALANERFDDVEVEEDLAARARLDRYLESYGIPPTLGVLRRRLAELDASACVAEIALSTIAEFGGADLDEDDAEAWESEARDAAVAWMERTRIRYDPYGMVSVDPRVLTRADRRRLGLATPLTGWARGLGAIRDRLQCEGHLRGRLPDGLQLDRKTRAALAEFERRHRIYTRGALSGETLNALRIHPHELLRHDLLRVLTERARLDWGVLEDGSAETDLVVGIRRHLEAALGLQDVVGMRRFFADFEESPHAPVEVPPFELPSDYSGHMALSIEIDRGDVRFDPPFDEDGRYIEPPRGRRPFLTVYSGQGDARRELVQWPTTVGGWRTQQERGRTVWAYKESPAGPGQWVQIVAAPVWLPPSNTPDSDLVTEHRLDDGEIHPVLKRTLLGPGYASAYGLAAAIHQPLIRGRPGRDEGIRTHGSVDYTSVWRRASHGCHRLQNHRAVALFSFLLAHRRHRYRGPRRVDYRRRVQVGEESVTLTVNRTGEVFLMDPPVPFEVLPGRTVGTLQRAPRTTYPADTETP